MGADKIAHAVMGVLAAIFALAFTGSPIVAMFAAAAAGIAKEAWDATGRGTVDFWDFVATAVGGAVVAIIAWAAL